MATTTGSKPRRKQLRAQDVKLTGKAAREAKAMQAAMAAHRAGYDAYVAARKAGTARDTHREAYASYKRAYGQLLALRHAAAAEDRR